MGVTMTPIRCSILVPVHAERTFMVLSDIGHMDEVIPDITAVEMLTKGPVGEGTRFRETRICNKKPQTMELWISQYDHQQRRMAIECKSMGGLFRTEILVIQMQDDRCEITMEMTVKMQGILASGVWLLIGAMTRRILSKALQKDLKHVREHMSGLNTNAPSKHATD
jgi:ribosome-associated toxin RatA of RatAB toxin-antitoxin module